MKREAIMICGPTAILPSTSPLAQGFLMSEARRESGRNDCIV